MPEFIECCQKTFYVLSYAVATVGSIAYCFYLIWLLAYLKDSGYYWFFAFIPGLLGIVCFVTANSKLFKAIAEFSGKWEAFAESLKGWKSFAFAWIGVLLMVMCSFTMLTRQAYYHVSPDAFIGPRWVIMSLQGSIVFFVCGFLTDKHCKMDSILKDKDILSRGLLDFVDIFNLVEILSLNQCVGIGSTVTEGSSLEMAIQAFCTISFVIVFFINEGDKSKSNENEKIQAWIIYIISLILQNIPFLVIRIIVWAKYSVFSLDFMVKNVLAIVVCCAEIQKGYDRSEGNDGQNKDPKNANVPGHKYNNNM